MCTQVQKCGKFVCACAIHTFSIDLIRFFLGKDPSQFVNLREAG